MMVCRDLLYIAFREARVLLRPQAVNSTPELNDGMLYLNQQIDYWSARGCYAWTTTFMAFPLVPDHQPYLIGPGLTPPDFDVPPPRPVKIHSSNVILIGTTPVDIEMNIRDRAWWAANQVKSLTSTFPTDVYYEPDVPNGQLWFWPIATAANGVRLEVWVVLQQFQNLDDPFIAPPAYQSAVTLTLAEELCDIWGTQCPPSLPRRAMKARDALQSNNNLAPRISTADWGTFSSPSGDFNYRTGTLPSR